MPPLPRLKLPVLRELERELRFAPPDALRRDIARVESLLGDLDPQTTYPDEWVVFRVTGYRREETSEGAAGGSSSGSALLGDLSVFLERLCDAAGLTLGEHEAASIRVYSVDELCARWRVSRKTLDRWRRRGLSARRVRDERGRSRLLFVHAHVEAFAARYANELRRAAAFTRLDEAAERRIVSQAARYRRCLGLSLNAAAERLAKRHGRSHEAIRQVLRRHERDTPIFREEPPIDARARLVLYRAWRAGVDPATMARKYKRTTSAIRRAILLVRAERLRDLAEQGKLHAPVGPTFRRADAADVLLAPAPVRTGLAKPVPTDLFDMLETARRRQPVVGVEERSRLVAYHFLRWSSVHAIAGLDRLHPSAEEVDRIETNLRWAARLKAELLRPQLFLILETLELRLGRRLTELPAALASAHVRRALAKAAEAIDSVDPFRSSRVAAAVGLEVDRDIALWLKTHPATRSSGRRAASILVPGTPFPDWTLSVAPWQAWLEPDARARAGASTDKMPEAPARFLRRRFGWDGGPPATLVELMAEHGIAPTAVARFERRAIRMACTIRP
jgi:RNA polymerase primary sigma factor